MRVNLFSKSVFISFWLCWVSTAAGGLSLAVGAGPTPRLRCVASHWVASLLRSAVQGSRASVVAAHGLGNCGTWAYLLPDLPGTGIEPVSPGLAGGFLATGPPGKSGG